MEHEEKEIGGYTYRVAKLNFGKWRALGLKVGAILSPVLGKLMEEGDGTEGKGVSEAARLFFDALTEAELKKITDTLSECTVVVAPDGTATKLSGVAEVHFNSHRKHYMPWLVFALRVQLADFFGEGGILEGLKALGTGKL